MILASSIIFCLLLNTRVLLAIEKRNALKREGDSSASMKVLIAAAQAKQRARHSSTGKELHLCYFLFSFVFFW